MFPDALRRSVGIVCAELSKGNFDYIPDSVRGFPGERIIEISHKLINEEISKFGQVPVPGHPGRTFLITEAMVMLLDAADIRTLLTSPI